MSLGQSQPTYSSSFSGGSGFNDNFGRSSVNNNGNSFSGTNSFSSESSSGTRSTASNACAVGSSSDLTGEQGLELIRLVMQEARARSISVTICIRDRHDNMVAQVRMKGALLGSVSLACDKARTSALFPFPSKAIQMFPSLALSNGIISSVAGGLPLIGSSGQSVGSIGVSGAMTGAEDEEIAQVAVNNIDTVINSF